MKASKCHWPQAKRPTQHFFFIRFLGKDQVSFTLLTKAFVSLEYSTYRTILWTCMCFLILSDKKIFSNVLFSKQQNRSVQALANIHYKNLK